MPGTVSHISSCTVQVIIGVDTHKDQHVAVAIDGRGVRLDEKHVRRLRVRGARAVVPQLGTDSRVRHRGHRLLRCRTRTLPDLQSHARRGQQAGPICRYRKGKSDPTDAEMAARSVLAGVADATPKSGEGEVEMIRMLKGAKDSAIKARTQAVNQMKALVVTSRLSYAKHCRSHCPHYTVQELPSWSSGTPRRRRSTHFDRLPAVIVDSMRRFRSGDRVGTTHQSGSARPG